MKKYKILITTLVMVLIMTISYHTQAITINDNEISKTILEKNNYELEVSEKVEQYLHNNLNGEYPSYFGGMYISDDSSKLIVQVSLESTNNKKQKLSSYQKKSMLESLSKIDDTIQIEYVDNSYNELNEVNTKIINYFSKNNNYTNLVGNYIDVYQNLVIVELKDNSEEMQEIFKKEVINSDLIKFIEKEENINTATTLKAGQGIPSDITNNFCSVGYRAKINGKEGYITAGHCVKELNSVIYTGKAIRYQFSGNVDAAFIEVNSSFSLLNSLKYYLAPVFSVHTVTSSQKITVGMKVAKSGVTTQYTSGKVVSNNYSTNAGGVYLTNMVMTDVKADSGDSGGPVYIPGNNGGTILGIVSGRNKSTVNSMYFTLESNIFAAFKYTGY